MCSFKTLPRGPIQPFGRKIESCDCHQSKLQLNWQFPGWQAAWGIKEASFVPLSTFTTKENKKSNRRQKGQWFPWGKRQVTYQVFGFVTCGRVTFCNLLLRQFLGVQWSSTSSFLQWFGEESHTSTTGWVTSQSQNKSKPWKWNWGKTSLSASESPPSWWDTR